MPNRDNYYDSKFVNSIRSQKAAATVTGSAVDLLGVDAVTVLADVGASTLTASGSNYFALTLTESSGSASGTSTGTYTTVAYTDLLGAAVTTDGAWGKIDSTAKTSKSYAVGYIGAKRFIKAVATKTGTYSAQISVNAIGRRLGSAPVSPIAS